MRKVLSFVLVLSLVLGSCGFAFASTDTTTTSSSTVTLSDISGLDCEDAVNVLSELSVINGYTDGTYKPENIVTRAEMAVIIIKALGLSGYATGKSNFTDMANATWAQGYVAYAQSIGVIVGYGDGTFKPNQTVSYNEAAKMLVAALGYTQASLTGTWPANYVSKAQDLGILDGITASATGANRGDIAIMAYQTLDVPMVRLNSDNDIENIKGDPNSDGTYDAVTMMTKLGVEDYDGSGAFYDKDGNYEFVVTGDEDTDINLMPYYGKLVKAYQNDDGDIIAIKEVVSKSITGEWDDADQVFTTTDDVDYSMDADTTDTYRTYDDDGTAGNYNRAQYFLNGDSSSTKPFGDTTSVGTIDDSDTVAALIDGATYTVNGDISGTSIKKLVSVEAWDVTESGQWDSDSLSDVTDDNSLLNVDFTLDDSDNIDADSYALFGAKDFASIPDDAVIYVYKDATNEEITRVEVGTKVVSGEVTKVNNAGDKFTIDGVTYQTAYQLDGSTEVNTFTKTPKAGDDATLYLDYNGKIWDADKISGTASKIAVILDYDTTGNTGSLGDQAQIELMLADGTSKVFDVDYDEIAGDDEVYTVLTQANASGTYGWNTDVDRGDLIEYDTNSAGDITEIDLMDTQDYQPSKTITAAGYYNGIKVDSDAPIFSYDATSTSFAAIQTANVALDDDDFTVTTLAKVLDTSDVQAFYYLSDDDSDGNIAAMIVNSNNTSSDEVYGVVTDDGSNSSDAGYYVETLIDGVTATYDTEEKFDPADYLDVYAITFNADNEASFDTLTTGDASYSYLQAPTTGAGFEMKVNSSKVVTIATTSPTPTAHAGFGTTFTATTAAGFSLDSNVKVYVWNSDDGVYELGSISDMKDDDNYRAYFYDLFADIDDQDDVVDLVLLIETDDINAAGNVIY